MVFRKKFNPFTHMSKWVWLLNVYVSQSHRIQQNGRVTT